MHSLFSIIFNRKLLLAALCSGVAAQAGAQNADLQIFVNGPADVPAGQQATYTVAVRNSGPAAANGASFAVMFNPSLQQATARCNPPPAGGAACAQPSTTDGRLFTGNIPALPPQGAVTVEIQGLSPGGTVTANAQVMTPPGVVDPNAGNNQAVTTTLSATLQHFEVD